MKKKLFISIPLSKEILEKLIIYQEQYPQEFIRWIPSKNLHITIYFLGKIDQKLISELISKLNYIAVQTKYFALEFEQIIKAPNDHRPSMIWAKFKNNEKFESLTKIISQEVKEFIENQNLYKNKKTIPHVTIARCKNSFKLKKLKLNQTKLSNLEVDSFHLMESQLNSDSAIYSIIETFILKRG